MSTDAHTPRAREKRIVIAVILVYVTILVVLFALGKYAFFPKEVLLPGVFIPAALSSQIRRLIDDWLLFITAVVLFDACRGLSFSMVCEWDFPVYMGYAITLENVFLGDTTLPHMMQDAWLGDAPGFFEHALVAVHASHFLVFLFVAMVLWHFRRDDFGQFKVSFLLVVYVGLATYLLVPTVPPWMAAQKFEVLPPLRHVTQDVYNLALPALTRKFDTNPIAAMPSLHAALPILFSLVTWRHFRWRSFPVLLYTALVLVCITYLGEHYLVDVIAGALLAVIAYAAVYHWAAGWIARVAGRVATRPLREKLLWAGLLVALTISVAGLNRILGAGWTPSKQFVASELEGKSPVADYYLGYYAFTDEDLDEAVAAFERLPARLEDRHSARMLALSYAGLGRVEQAVQSLSAYARAHPDEPDPLYWATRIMFEHGRIRAQQVLGVAAQLEQRYRTPLAHDYAAALRDLVGDPPNR